MKDIVLVSRLDHNFESFSTTIRQKCPFTKRTLSSAVRVTDFGLHTKTGGLEIKT